MRLWRLAKTSELWFPNQWNQKNVPWDPIILWGVYIEALASFPFHTSSSCTLLSLLCGILHWFCFFTQILGMRVKTFQRINSLCDGTEWFVPPSFTHRKPGLQCDSDERTGNREVDPVGKRVGGWSHEYRKRFSLSVRSVYYLLEQC